LNQDSAVSRFCLQHRLSGQDTVLDEEAQLMDQGRDYQKKILELEQV
jgi:hypothetical protein